MPSPSRLRPTSTLLVVDDEETIRKTYAAVLSGAGYVVVMAKDGIEALDVARRVMPSLILLDVDMPRANGWETLQRLQAEGCHPPVVMLTGCTEIDDRVKGLSLGADDYLCKPCNSRELLARVHAVLRRSQPRSANDTILTFGRLTVNLVERAAQRGTEPVRFTRTEYALLELFARDAGRIVTRERMLEQVWGYEAESNTRTVDTHIWRLRQKLQDSPEQPQWIETVTSGGGYRMAAECAGLPVRAYQSA